MSSNSLPTGKSFQSNATKFPHPGLHIATQYPKAEPKKGIMKISPKKNSAIFIYKRCCITKDTSVPVTAAIILLSIIRVTLRRIRNLSGESPHFVSLNIPFLRVQRMSSRSFQTVRRMREAWKREAYVRSQCFSSESAVKYLHVGRRKIQISSALGEQDQSNALPQDQQRQSNPHSRSLIIIN